MQQLNDAGINNVTAPVASAMLKRTYRDGWKVANL